ncbi:MAG TPA: 6,7-dimethyl-8-ribityllumazine synthase [Acidimicrobiia bacterium]|nr:6,7-dimethyl-8-ribityllumazine synthase [Acidimicrobiia bacterium]
MTRVVEGNLEQPGLMIGVAAARWNQSITDRLVDGALGRLAELGIDDVVLLRVPGALELPLACRELALAGCQGVVAIGAVVKGETDHYEIVVNESARGLTLAALETGVPITNAVLAVHDFELAMARAGDGRDNKGVEAVDAAVELAAALVELRST